MTPYYWWEQQPTGLFVQISQCRCCICWKNMQTWTSNYWWMCVCLEEKQQMLFMETTCLLSSRMTDAGQYRKSFFIVDSDLTFVIKFSDLWRSPPTLTVISCVYCFTTGNNWTFSQLPLTTDTTTDWINSDIRNHRNAFCICRILQ